MKTETDGNTLTFFFDGDLTDDAAGKATKACARALKSLKKQQRIAIDLSTAEEIDPEGIALLLALCSEAEANGLQFTILGAPDNLLNLLKTLGLTERFALPA